MDSIYARVKVPGGSTHWVPLTADVAPGSEAVRAAVRSHPGEPRQALSRHDHQRDHARAAHARRRGRRWTTIRTRVSGSWSRSRFGCAVTSRSCALSSDPDADPAIREMLRERFELSPSDLYDMAEEVDYTTLFEIAGLPMPELRDQAWIPLPHPLSPIGGRGFCRHPGGRRAGPPSLRQLRRQR